MPDELFRRRSAAIAGVVSLVLVATTGLGSTGASAAPSKLPDPNLKARTIRKAAASKVKPMAQAAQNKTQTVFVQLSGSGAADVSAKAINGGSASSVARGKAKARSAQVRGTAKDVTAQARKTDGKAKELFATTNSVPGVGLQATTAALEEIAKRPDVVKITPIIPRTYSNASSGELVKALATWQSTGNTGKGVRVGIIDTGIDYTHADFGGAGTTEAYEAAHATADSGAPWTPTEKVVGGWDFVGDDYDADPSSSTYQPIPKPDPNPLDCNGHGTHVAGTTAGYGVSADGSTYTGSYSSLTSSTLAAMKIGPGMAPEASLYALRVFGCEGSTDMVIPALDWALDPNGDGSFSDHLDIVNLSLGSDFGATDDPEVDVVNNLAAHGVLPVFSSGNSGDVTDVGGAPGNAARALTVASSVDAANALDGLTVDEPADVAGTVAGQMSVAYPWATSDPVTGTVVKLSDPSNLDGCQPLSTADAAAVAGKVAWLVWDDDDATRACGSVARSGNVVAAGAIGALFTSTLAEFSAGITGSATVPVFQLNGPATQKLDAAATAGSLVVTFDGSLATSEPLSTPARVDTLSDFSSRGARGLPGVVKPDVTAPGETIISAGVGTGNGRANYSGTSMAAPHISGIAALVKKKHPTWSVEQLKAAIMNTAVHDLYTGENSTGKRYGPNRVGSGRTDAAYAVSTDVLAYSRSDRGVVSASFGVVEAPITSSKVTRSKLITVVNKGKSTRSISLSYSTVVSQPGVSYSVSPSRITLRKGKSATVKVTMTIRPSSLRHSLDPTMSATTADSLVGEGSRQYVSDASGRLLVKPSGKTALRVPVYGAAKPVSKTTVVATTDAGESVLKVTGKGFDQGSGDTVFTSVGSAMELGSSSRKLPTCAARQTSNCVLNGTARSLDLQYTGVGSLPGADIGWFGFSTWGNWTSMKVSGEVDVAVDTDNDGEANYWVVYYPGSADQPLSLIFDSSGTPFAAYSVNFLDYIGPMDTNVFDTNTAVLPFSLSDLGVSDTDTSFPIKYRVETYSYYGDPSNGNLVDATDWVSADLRQPTLLVSDPVFPDVAGMTVTYSVSGASASSTTTGTESTATGTQSPDSTATVSTISAPSMVKALVLHLHGGSGGRAQVVTLGK